MWRKAASLLIILLGAIALHRYVVVPYRCNIVKGDARRAFARAKATGNGFQMRTVALRNLPALEECRQQRPRDPELAMMLGEHLEAAGRAHAARDVFCGALSFSRTPLLHLACANASLAVGDRKTALENLIVVGEFAGPRALSNVPDAEIRWEATRRAGVLFEKNAIARGELSLRNLVSNSTFSAADGKRDHPHESVAESWILHPTSTAAVAAIARNRGRGVKPALLVETKHADAGVVHVLRPTSRKPRIIATAWVFVERGTVCFGASDGRSLRTNVCSKKTGVWEKLESVNESCPAVSISLLSGSGEGARFLVDEVTARETLAAPLCER